MDHYKVLGLNKNATKSEIKEAFRKMALQFHPDKHTHSPKHVRDNAILKFRQVNEAYQVLITRADYKSSNGSSSGGGYGYNDSKRADYKSSSGNSSSGYGYDNSKRTDYKSGKGSSGGGYGYDDSKRTDYKSHSGSTSGKNQSQSGSRPRSSTWAASKWGFDPHATLQYMTSRPFLRNLAFASVLLGGAVIVKKGGDALSKEWREFKEKSIVHDLEKRPSLWDFFGA